MPEIDGQVLFTLLLLVSRIVYLGFLSLVIPSQSFFMAPLPLSIPYLLVYLKGLDQGFCSYSISFPRAMSSIFLTMYHNKLMTSTFPFSSYPIISLLSCRFICLSLTWISYRHLKPNTSKSEPSSGSFFSSCFLFQ